MYTKQQTVYSVYMPCRFLLNTQNIHTDPHKNMESLAAEAWFWKDISGTQTYQIVSMVLFISLLHKQRLLQM